MKASKLTDYQMKVLEQTSQWTLRKLLAYITETETKDLSISPEEAMKLIAQSVRSLKYENRVARAGLRQATQRADRLAQLPIFRMPD